MIETYCDACGARLEDAHEGDVMVYFQCTPETCVDKLYRFCPACSIDMRGELENMAVYAGTAKRGKHARG